MTIAEFISVSDTEKLVREIGRDLVPSGSFLCDHPSHVVPDESFNSENSEGWLLALEPWHKPGNLAAVTRVAI
jgi:hypothetical protein